MRNRDFRRSLASFADLEAVGAGLRAAFALTECWILTSHCFRLALVGACEARASELGDVGPATCDKINQIRITLIA